MRLFPAVVVAVIFGESLALLACWQSQTSSTLSSSKRSQIGSFSGQYFENGVLGTTNDWEFQCSFLPTGDFELKFAFDFGWDSRYVPDRPFRMFRCLTVVDRATSDNTILQGTMWFSPFAVVTVHYGCFRLLCWVTQSRLRKMKWLVSVYYHKTQIQIVPLCWSCQYNVFLVVSAVSSSVGVNTRMNQWRMEDLIHKSIREENDTLP